MNRSEYNRLSSPFLSHLARSLYLFIIKPKSDASGRYTIDYAVLIHELSVFALDSNELIYRPGTEEVTAAILNLVKIQLLTINQQSSQFRRKDGFYSKAQTAPAPIRHEGRLASFGTVCGTGKNRHADQSSVQRGGNSGIQILLDFPRFPEQ